jgi:hypothetical protein
MSLDKAKYMFEIICKKKKNPLYHKIMKKHPKKKEQNIRFGSQTLDFMFRYGDSNTP